MLALFNRLLNYIDGASEIAVRRSAQLHGRRSALAHIGKVLVGGAVLPMLPFDRSEGLRAHAADAEPTDQACEYWRYCALDGFLCTCCGGTVSLAAPPTAKAPGTNCSSIRYACANTMPIRTNAPTAAMKR